MLKTITRTIDRLLWLVAHFGALAMTALVLITVYDVLTRYFGIPKFAGLNSTMLQESEFWAHTVLFATFLGFALVKQAHVRIDLVRDTLPTRVKYFVEMAGLLFLLMPFSVFGFIYSLPYVVRSFATNEISSSTVGLSNVWLLKGMLLVMFCSLFFAGLSQLLKCIDGLLGNLNEAEEQAVIGGGHE
ncbi:TRAP transporter small permease subunit [Maritalea porphyrae]|uniref:TRAP transporter small permease subunit n=1 Tax=Maritalea porphyrae TaxID=880732 RepID=UPI0022AFDE0D|nr:TRAP transporter small permease subunit [Maritalea porphyrae]MCZ4273406.1 TRAP transporter small permease subunit [Maritalea porphyrae]